MPFYFLVRGIYGTTTLAAAVEAVQTGQRAIPGNLALATPQGPADLEITLKAVHLLRDEGTGMVIHTNHCLHPELAAINDQFPELIQSGPRQRRMEQFLKTAPKPLSLEILQTALRDHQDYPRSICRHPNDHPVNGFWVSVLSVIMEVEAGLMHVSRGNPCENPYETYTLN